MSKTVSKAINYKKKSFRLIKIPVVVSYVSMHYNSEP